jgi:hypothetical protein
MSESHSTAEGLAERLFGAALEAMDLMSVYIGDRLGYYRLLANGGSATAGELAARAGTHERYAREWLEQQATTGIVDVDDPTAAPDVRRFSLPAGHAEVLTDPVSLAYMAPAAQMLAAAGHQLGAIVEAHRSGGGVSHPGSVGTGTIMRHATLELYAHEAGFESVEVLPIEADLWRFYRLR